MFLSVLFTAVSALAATCPYTQDQFQAHLSERFGAKAPKLEAVMAQFGNLGFNDSDATYLCSVPSLKNLSIFNDQTAAGKLTGASLESIATLHELVELDVDGNNISAVDLGKLAGLDKLETLEIGIGNPLGDAGMEQIDLLPSLKNLRILNGGLTAKDLDWLSRSNKMFDQLDLSGNKNLGHDALAKLQFAKAKHLVIEAIGLQSADGLELVAANKNLQKLSVGEDVNFSAPEVEKAASLLSQSSTLTNIEFQLGELTSVAAMSLAKIPSLKEATFIGNYENPDELASLVQNLTSQSVEAMTIMPNRMYGGTKQLELVCKALVPKFPQKSITVIMGRNATLPCSAFVH